MLAGGGSPWYGPAVWRSDDLGETWTHSSEGLTYGDDGAEDRDGLERHRGPTTRCTPASSRRACSAATTAARPGARRGPDATTRRRPEWQPGNGGLILHSIVPSPDRCRPRMWVGISSVGAFETARRRRDLGDPEQGRSGGLHARGQQYPDFGQCVHKLVMAADGGEHLYQQNHCGVYRSSDGGKQWEEITPGLPSEFGFPMARPPARPEDGLDDPAERGRPGPVHAGRPRRRVAHARRRRHWQPLRRRPAAATTPTSACCARRWPSTGWIRSGVYFGTSTGPAVRQRGRGPQLALIADNLPPIWSVEAAVVG